MVLAHQGSVATSLSYANVQVNFNIKPAALEMPPKELLDQMYRELIFLRKRVEKLTKQQGVVVTSNKQEAGFVTKDGKVVQLERHTKRKFIDEADRKATFEHFAAELTKNGLEVNQTNIEKLGLGREIQRKFLGKREKRAQEPPNDLAEQKEEQPSANSPSTPPVTETTNRPKEQRTQKQERAKQHAKENTHAQPGKYHTLQDNEKVVLPNPKGERARIVAHERDKEVWRR